jgi:hypothetical protein
MMRVDLSVLISEIKAKRGRIGLSSAVRQFIVSNPLDEKEGLAKTPPSCSAPVSSD